jgi:hypothetical protein
LTRPGLSSPTKVRTSDVIAKGSLGHGDRYGDREGIIWWRALRQV